MKRIARYGMLMIALLVVSACAAPGSGGAAVPEETITVARGTVRSTVGGSGTVQPIQSADLQFTTTGTISDVLVTEGEQVEQEQELAQIDTELLNVQLESARAQRDAAQAQRDAADAQRAAAVAQRDAAVAQRDRIDEAENSSDTGSGLQAVDTSDAAKSQADAQITQASSQITQAEAQTRQADAQIRQADAQIAQAELSLEQATIRAPFAGIVTAVNVAAGDSAGAGVSVSATGGSSAPFTVADTSSYYVEANINEADIGGVENGQTTEVIVDALNNEPITGTVRYVAPAATTQQNVSTYLVRIELPEDVEGLRIGMSASVDISQEERQNVLVIPASAIRSEGSRRIVRVQQGEQFVDREIQTGLTNDVDTEIVSGLNEGDVIATIGTADEE